MSRWEPNARERLSEAALELYAERGFEQTTVAEIAGRAGLTERTFFRHFGDKREVLFGGAEKLLDLLAETVAAAPAGAAPIEAVAAALAAAGRLIRDPVHSRRRQAVIDANAELRERELIKLASWAVTLTAALRDRGAPEGVAHLAAETGVAVFKVAFGRWLAEHGEADMPALVRDCFAELKGVTAGL
ncbi:TetR family transcriptional regulator [Phytomonospora endophytica]|uniref:AcrR family transcriptional regulator n=1 Tax=Phytomonospora endophytica TaxID=714109 RepID=A0A841FN98_9ACTN|nr:TetR family transcriptional regulator [Phytomonospora endophytica]MBB6038791.1 AcrR family transcriptional regulator [Phytomonospora endophytica]GIG68413.1 TetR family transcriptional regulator [Phytomonospora endophytica]